MSSAWHRSCREKTPLAIGLVAERFGLDAALRLLLVAPFALLALVPREPRTFP